MSPTPRSSRRRFLRRTAAAAAALALPGAPAIGSRALGAAAPADATGAIGIGLIGCGSLGVNYHLRKYLPMDDVRLVAVCDVDRSRREQAADRVKNHYGSAQRPGCYNDYRELLDRKDVDAVIVVTPDHWHALQTIHACQAGKDVHCEKPLTLTVAEGRAMVNAARRHARIVQCGSESRSNASLRRACELVRNGRIGKLHTVRAGLGANPFCPWVPPGAKPAGLDWNLWLGPAPAVPYHVQRCFYTFRWFRDYSGGKLTDWGAHMNDIAHWGMGTDDIGPVRVEAKARHVPGNLYEFAPEFEVVYTYENGVRLISSSDAPHVTFEGTLGTIRTRFGDVSSSPADIATTPLGANDLRLQPSDDHDRDWLRAIRTRERPVADVEIGHRSATVCHLGNIALRLGRPLEWDWDWEEFMDDDDANRHLSKPMRAPWHL